MGSLICSLTNFLVIEVCLVLKGIPLLCINHASNIICLFNLSGGRRDKNSCKKTSSFINDCISFYCICVKPATLCNCLCSSCFSASVIRNIGEFRAKNSFTDHQTSNTIPCFRDSIPVLKIHDCY